MQSGLSDRSGVIAIGKRTRLPIAMLVALAVTFMAACGGGTVGSGAPATGAAATTAPTAAPLKPMKLGSAGGINYTILAMMYAADNGLFEKYGYKAEVAEVQNDTVGIQGLVGRTFDGLSANAGTGLAAVSQGAQITLVGALYTRVDYFFVTRGVPDLKSLEGKSLGISAPGSGSDIITKLLLRKAGVDISKVNFVAVGPDADRARAIAAGTIHGAVLNTVTTISATKNADLKIIADVGSQLATDWQNGGLWVPSALVREDPAMVQALVSGSMEGARVLQSDRAKAIEYAIKRGLPQDSVAEAYDRIVSGTTPFFGVDGGIDQKSFESTVKILHEAGSLKTAPTWAQTAEPKFIQAALAKLGPYKK